MFLMKNYEKLNSSKWYTVQKVPFVNITALVNSFTASVFNKRCLSAPEFLIIFTRDALIYQEIIIIS